MADNHAALAFLLTLVALGTPLGPQHVAAVVGPEGLLNVAQPLLAALLHLRHGEPLLLLWMLPLR